MEKNIHPTTECHREVIDFLSKLPAGIPPPHIGVADDGEVVLDWLYRDQGKEATVGFDGDGIFGYALYRDGKYRAGEFEGRCSDKELPIDLVEYLNSIENE